MAVVEEHEVLPLRKNWLLYQLTRRKGGNCVFIGDQVSVNLLV